ncbi:MAG: SprT-like domain-containing protein [Verrucomicrobiae bacterium]|nr:SprT-like domain-containing protein [Verrucomicrobiae bacterium]
MPEPGIPCQLDLFSDHAPIGIEFVLSTPPVAEAPGLAGIPSREEVNEAELTRKASDWAASLGLEGLAGRLRVLWNRRMRTTAGRAFYEGSRIELNPRMLRMEGVDRVAEIERTLKHELAHLIAHARGRGRAIAPHGEEWRRACADLGIPGEPRCHTLPLEAREIRRRYLYLCPACGAEIARVRRYRQSVACYECCKKHSRGRYDPRFRLRVVAAVQKSR